MKSLFGVVSVAIYFAICVAVVKCDDGNAEIDKLMLGTFEHEHDGAMEKEFKELMIAAEFSEEYIKKAEEAKYISITISKLGDNKYSCLKQIYNCPKGACEPAMKKTHEFSPGVPFKSERCDKKTYEGTLTFKDNHIVLKESKFEGFTCHKEMNFSQEGFKLTATCKDKTAICTFKRKA